MKPAPFDYVRPATVDEVIAALASTEDAKVLAGGQSLAPLMNLRLARPAMLVDLDGVGELRRIEAGRDHLVLGAMTRHCQLAEHPTVRRHAPLLAHAAALIGHRAIRARGTIGGSLAHADPAAELAVVAQVLDADVEVAGPSGRRQLAARQLFVGPLETSLAADEVIVTVRIGLDAGARDWGFAELARRPGDFALVVAAVTVTVDIDGACRQAALAIGGAGPTATLVGAAGRALVGTRLDDTAVDAAAAAAVAAARPVDDLGGSAAYRRAMVGVMARRAVEQARGGRR
jgi:carbon-monoxide dehydrogenase medium subunit